MNINNCVGWCASRNVGAKVGRGHNEGVEIDVGAEVGGEYGEGV